MFFARLGHSTKKRILRYYTTHNAKMQRTKPIKVLLKQGKKIEKSKLVCLLMRGGMIEYIHIRFLK